MQILIDGTAEEVSKFFYDFVPEDETPCECNDKAEQLKLVEHDEVTKTLTTLTNFIVDNYKEILHDMEISVSLRRDLDRKLWNLARDFAVALNALKNQSVKCEP